MKIMCSRARQLKIAIFVYSPARGSRPDHSLWKNPQSRTRRVGSSYSVFGRSTVMLLENFLWKCNMEYTLYPWVSLLEYTLEISYKLQT